MCGLAGIICWTDALVPDGELLGRMSRRIAHRGPDASGTWTSPTRPAAALIHQRLAVIDLDHRADQPFLDDAGRCLVYNGEIYNFRELKAELTSLHPDYAWRTTCDTEVLLLAYTTWSTDCLRRLNGMFAFTVYDPADGSLFLARDRMGQKPLYYARREGEAIAFASEPGALLEVPWVDRTIDRSALADYLMWGYVPGRTIYRGIGKLAPSTWMRVSAAGMRSGVYFERNEMAHPPATYEQAVTQTRELVVRSVRRRLVADVPLGCFLSGGIDSSIIAAAMRQSAPPDQDVLTFSIGFDDPRYDETPYAANVARHLGTKHRQFIVRPDAAHDLPKLAAAFAEPLGDSSALPTHYLSRETRRHVTVALSGDGGDELFGGYDRYRAMALSQRLSRMPRALVRLLRTVVGEGGHPKSRRNRLGRLLAGMDLPPAQRYAAYTAIFPLADVELLLGEGAAESERVLTDRFEALRADRDTVQAAMAVDRELYLPEDLLTKVDRCSMLHALEVRSPFMDWELVRFAAGLPTRWLVGRRGKRLLRHAFAADLPEEVFHRPKMGFAVPIGEWFRGGLRALLHDALLSPISFVAGNLSGDAVRRLVEEHESGRIDHSQRLYALLMLELWHSA